MSMTLHVGSKGYSSWSLRAYLALAQTGADAEVRTIILDQPTSKAELLAVNPTGRVPVLHHNGLVIWDSLAICEYLNELYPAALLWPADRSQRARARAVSAEMHSSFAALRNAMPMDLIATDRLGKGHTLEALSDARRIHAVWRECLAESGGPFLFGAFTIADAMYAPVTTRFTTYGVELDAACRAYVDAVQALPSFVAWKRDAQREPVLPDHQ
jgi:glutathione S-transferase